MNSKFKVNQKVKVNCDNPFTGEVKAVLKWQNPFSIEKEGYDYHVKADDDQSIYKCKESEISINQ